MGVVPLGVMFVFARLFLCLAVIVMEVVLMAELLVVISAVGLGLELAVVMGCTGALLSPLSRALSLD